MKVSKEELTGKVIEHGDCSVGLYELPNINKVLLQFKSGHIRSEFVLSNDGLANLASLAIEHLGVAEKLKAIKENTDV